MVRAAAAAAATAATAAAAGGRLRRRLLLKGGRVDEVGAAGRHVEGVGAAAAAAAERGLRDAGTARAASIATTTTAVRCVDGIGVLVGTVQLGRRGGEVAVAVRRVTVFEEEEGVK